VRLLGPKLEWLTKNCGGCLLKSLLHAGAALLGIAMIAVPWWLAMPWANYTPPVWQNLQAFVPVRDTVTRPLRVGMVASPTIASTEIFAQVRGLERGLVEQFARQSAREVSFTTFNTPAAARAALIDGKIDLAPLAYTSDDFDKLRVTSVNYIENPWIFAYAPLVRPPTKWQFVDKQTVSVLPRIYDSPQFAVIADANLAVRFQRFEGHDEEELMAAIDTGKVSHALIDANLYDALQHIYTGVGRGMTVQKNARAWLTRAEDNRLHGDAQRFLQHAVLNRTVHTLGERHFGHTRAVNSFDASVFEERIVSTLPEWKPLLQKAQEDTGVDWRLIASLAYQESQWQAKAVSYTGVWGFMQLTQDTANMYRVDRNDPTAAIAAGAKHIAYLLRATPDRIPEPDRTWFALAAYNIGLGHVESGRILAQRARLNPDSWADVKKMMLKLSDLKVAESLNRNTARGYEAVEYVDRIRAFYELMVRHEDPHLPKRPLLTPKVPVAKPELRTASL
jgi:membrane-bound lytic murein transglycosylase F